MCLAIPMKIESIEGKTAVCELDGVRRRAAVDLAPKAKVGDYVMIHAGFAIEIVDNKAAEETLALLKSL
ncbi:MAG: HypC/HybG/HupF family hydrogenase formation chaperone [Candidatus Omnitrophica bacterium]|nr:HypC/HybG/HupF family hydrogenase formation chaperone [Candidatus Omnitrophota bacterium]